MLKANKAKEVTIVDSDFIENYSKSICISVQGTDKFNI